MKKASQICKLFIVKSWMSRLHSESSVLRDIILHIAIWDNGTGPMQEFYKHDFPVKLTPLLFFESQLRIWFWLHDLWWRQLILVLHGNCFVTRPVSYLVIPYWFNLEDIHLNGTSQGCMRQLTVWMVFSLKFIHLNM